MMWSISYIAFRILEKANRLEAKIDSAIVRFGAARSMLLVALLSLGIILLSPKLGLVLLLGLPAFAITLTFFANGVAEVFGAVFG